MSNNINPMGCGNCGHHLFRMFQQTVGNSFAMLAECGVCKSVTRIEPQPAALQLSFGEGSPGCLALIRGEKPVTLTNRQINDARTLVAQSVFEVLNKPGRIYGFRLVGVEDWKHDGMSMERVATLEKLNGEARVNGRIVVRFMEGAEVEQAYICNSDEGIILATITAGELRPSGKADA